jgi:hypothetical protein
LLAAKPALVMTVWQPTAALGSFSWGGEAAGMVNFVELDRAGAEDAGRIADEGVGPPARYGGRSSRPPTITM